MAGRQEQTGDADSAVSRTPTTPGKPRLRKSNTSPIKKEDKHQKQTAKEVSELKDYVRIFREILVLSGMGSADQKPQQLGDCLGKGAFGSVYKAFNWNTGETVAIKQIKLTDLPKSELRVIMVRGSFFLPWF